MSANPRNRARRTHALVDEQYDDAVQQREAATLGMWVFLATEILFFGVLFASYTICRVLYPQGFADASRHTDMLLGTIETAVLLTSSSLIALGVRAIKLDQRRAGSVAAARHRPARDQLSRDARLRVLQGIHRASDSWHRLRADAVRTRRRSSSSSVCTTSSLAFIRCTS